MTFLKLREELEFGHWSEFQKAEPPTTASFKDGNIEYRFHSKPFQFVKEDF